MTELNELNENIIPIEIEIPEEKELAYIYKITSTQTQKVYIGSTFKKLNVRLYQHKKSYNRFQNGKGKNVGAFDVVCFDDCVIEELESFEGLTRKALAVQERKYYDIYKANGVELCNINIPNRSKADWECENKLFLDNWKKEYRVKNREKYNKYVNDYYHNNKEKIIENQKKYHEKNKERISQYYKDYYLRKKEEKQQEPVEEEVKEETEPRLRQMVITLDLIYH